MREVGYSLRVYLTHRVALCSIAPLNECRISGSAERPNWNPMSEMVGWDRGADRASNDADVSSIPPIIPYGWFSQYGWKAGLSGGALPDATQLKSAPDIRCMSSSLHPPFVELVVTTIVPHCVGPQTRLRTAVEDHYSSAPEALARVRVVLSRSVIT